MSNVVNFNNRELKNINVAGSKCGEIIVSVFEGKDKTNPCFLISSSTEKVLPVSYVIEDTLYDY